MKPRPDLLDSRSPAGLEVFQITDEPGVSGAHVYMEAQVFTPDSRRFLLERSGTAHGSDKDDPRHQYLLCDTEDGGHLQPLTHETGATAPSVSPDGRTVYYLVNRTEPNGGTLTLKRVSIDGTARETMLVVDSPIAGTRCRPSQIYPLSTISSDGTRLATAAFLGDGKTRGAPWGLLVFDLQAPSVAVILEGQTWCNLHPQYSRSRDPGACRDILVQENHGNVCNELGEFEMLVSGAGADIHVIRDDGTCLRDLPWGRDGYEFCQGHQCWRGRSTRAITSTVTAGDTREELIEAQPVPHAGHLGLRTPGGVRHDLSRSFERPRFSHFATDADARRFITDAGPWDGGGLIYLARFGVPDRDPLLDWTYLLNARSTPGKDFHLHPFLSPDGRYGFFNSSESGLLQAYMLRLSA